MKISMSAFLDNILVSICTETVVFGSFKNITELARSYAQELDRSVVDSERFKCAKVVFSPCYYIFGTKSKRF